MAIPSLFLFHNGKAAARYNDTEYQTDLFSAFITRYTGERQVFTISQNLLQKQLNDLKKKQVSSPLAF